VQIQIQAPQRECRSIRLSASGLLYSCTTLVCVPDVIGMQTMWRHTNNKNKGGLAVWRHNKPKTKNQGPRRAPLIKNPKEHILCNYSDAHHPLNPVIKLGVRHSRKKKRILCGSCLNKHDCDHAYI
jgi:hypothetical protein